MNQLYRESDIVKKLQIARFCPLDILLVGGTGTGKSSTINAMFQQEAAAVGRGCDPQTTAITPMLLNQYLRFWDSPGLGDNVEKDMGFSAALKKVLRTPYTLDGKTYGLIDTVLVVLDGSGRDMGTTFHILSDTVLPNIQANRVIVAINQADMAMKGRHWNNINNCPDATLLHFLEEKAVSIRDRVREATGIFISKPVFYSAEKNYNVPKLLDAIIDAMPTQRRPL